MDEEEEQEIAASISVFRYGTGRKYAASMHESLRDHRTSACRKDSPSRREDETSDLIDNIIASHKRLRADLFSQTALFTETLSEQLATQTAVLSATLAEKVAQQTAQLNATMDTCPLPTLRRRNLAVKKACFMRMPKVRCQISVSY